MRRLQCVRLIGECRIALHKGSKTMNFKTLFKKSLLVAMQIAVIFMYAGFLPLAGSVVPVNLQCEYHSDPLGIDVAQPRLIWQVQSGERGQEQTAYQILVASSQKLLRNNHGDLWDSGRISSDETVDIAYAGRPLASGVQCFWKVRIWDKNRAVSSWSAPATWSMGLLEQKDWQGKWIGLDQGEAANPLDGAKWIWFPEGEPAVSAPAGTRYFRRVFELPSDRVVRAAIMAMTADNEFRLFVNGQEVGKGDDWRKPEEFAIGALLRPGKNLLAVEARNVGDGPTPAGLIARLKVLFQQGEDLMLGSDASWKSATNAEDGWNAPAFDD